MRSQWIDYGCTYLQSDWSWRVPLFVQCKALDDEKVLAEYKEIRDAVLADVSPLGEGIYG